MQQSFDVEKHEYRIGDFVVPSVTQILKDLGLIEDSYFSEYAADRGSKVHRMCLFYDTGDLNEDALDPVLSGYLQAYRSFRTSVPLSFHELERPIVSPNLGFAGTPDRVGMYGTQGVVVDIKTSQSISKWWGLQVAAYKMLASTKLKMTVRLSQDGRFRVDTWDDSYDDAWRAALSLYHWKHGG